MPLQRFDNVPVPRPSGLVPPVADLTGVTELRLHGVGGTTPEDLLGDLAPQHVSGDRIAGFYRTADVAGRHVEAYSWGGLTSRAGSRVLWLLLFPFALANVAGWMCTRRTHNGRIRFRLHRTAVRWVALGLTLNLLLIAALAGMDLLGYQCGGQPGCRDETWLLQPLSGAALSAYPGRRVLAGAGLPFALLVLLAILTLRSITRYEAVRPPHHVDPSGPAAPATRVRNAAEPGVGLSDPGFWDGQRSTLTLGYLHVAAGLAFLALLIGYPVAETIRLSGAPVAAGWLWPATVALGGAVLAGTLVLTALDNCPAPAAVTVLGAAVVSSVCAGWFATSQHASGQPAGHLPGLRVAANLTYGVLFGALLFALLVTLAGGWRRGTFLAYGPFVALTLSVFALNVVLLSTTIRAVSMIADVSFREVPPAVEPGRPVLLIYPIIGSLVQYLTVLPLALVLAFALYELVAYWRAGADRSGRERIRSWYLANVPKPPDEPVWQCSTLDDELAGRQRAVRLWSTMLGQGWTARIARARRFARSLRDVDKLLTAMTVIGVVALVAVEIRYWYFARLPWGTQWTFTVGSWLAAGIPVGIILLLRRGWRNLHSRRRIGIIWDVLTFWPRAYHPLAPPSYSERAVPELQRRLWRIHDNGGRVVLAAHSQGTVLAAAALLQRENRPDDDMVTLVTFGSPLRTLYGWAFPAYFPDEVLRRLAPAGDHVGSTDTGGPGDHIGSAGADGSDAAAGGSAVRLSAWRNFWYPTDYIGGPVLDPVPPAEVDVELPDPVTHWYIHGQPEPVASRHSGYWIDTAVWHAVDRLAWKMTRTHRMSRRNRSDEPERPRGQLAIPGAGEAAGSRQTDHTG